MLISCSTEPSTSRSSKRSSVDLEDTSPSPKRRLVTARTVDKWIVENDKSFNTSTWLEYGLVDRTYVSCLKCSKCTRFADKLQSVRNYNPAFIEGSKNLRASAFKDHAKSDMHKRAMLLFKKSQSSQITDYAPIAKALCSLDPTTESKLKRKFDIAYWICKENLPFNKMASLCELETRHEVDLGSGYKNDQACATFMSYIAKEQRDQLRSVLENVKFFSIQADGSTDAGIVEDELFTVLYLDRSGSDGNVHVRSKLFAVRQPKSGDAEGLFRCFEAAMSYVGIPDWTNKLIGFGCDGASVNIAAGGLRGHLEKSVPWVVVIWCLAHRLELSLKDALKGTLFSSIDDMLLRAYYLYHKSPKKCRELDEVVASLQLCLEDSEMPTSSAGGNRPIRACGTRFVGHKVTAIRRFIDRFGAYLGHLTTLIEDPSTKSPEKAKLKGYILKWRDAKMILGCALFLDLLKPAATLCKALQNDELSVPSAIEAILHTTKSLENLKDKNFDDYPTVKRVCTSIQSSDDQCTYQGTKLDNYEGALTYLRSHCSEWNESIMTCLKQRVKAQHTDLLTNSLTILATQGWEKTEGVEFSRETLDSIVTQFSTPLAKAGIDTNALQEEWEDMVDYAKRYLNIVQEDPSTIWWKLFNAACSKKWENILGVVELLYCLPMSNGRVERIFSTLKVIKSDRRTCLSENHLDNLLRISVDGPPPSKWDATGAVRLWWNDKLRRNVGDSRKPPKRTSSAPSTSSDTGPSGYELNLDDWDSFLLEINM